tara:strand:+ start:338 stop:730 length:393 start_codon:yes stop_codon:yes gene_type:complete
MVKKNIIFSLKEKDTNDISYNKSMHEELLNEIMENSDSDNNETYYNDINNDYCVLQIDYRENYKKKELERIAGYYGISIRKKKKDDLVDEIIFFEIAPENKEITQTRKRLWFYMDEIINDNYLSKFIILD